MTTTTSTHPWTEPEVREALTRSIGMGFVEMDDMGDLLRVVVDSDVARVRTPWEAKYYPPDDHPGTLWADLTPEEVEELQEAMNAVLHEVEREATEALLERAVVAALAFQERHPDVPRGHWPLAPAGPEDAP